MFYSIQYYLLYNKRIYQKFTNNFNTFLTQFLFYFNIILIQKILIFDFLISESLENTEFLFLGFKNVKNEKTLIFQHFLVFSMEATPGFEPGIRVLQTRALPLGYIAILIINIIT